MVVAGGARAAPSGAGLGTVWAGRPHVVQELQCPTLQRGRRRGGLLIAREAVRDGGRDDGPAGELGLERCHGGDLLECGADPQEVGLRLVLNRRGRTPGRRTWPGGCPTRL